MFNILRHCQTIFQSIVSFCFLPVMYKSPNSSKSSLTFSIITVLILAFLIGVQCYLIVVLICISSKTYKLNILGGAVSIQDFLHFLIELLVVLLLRFERFLYILIIRSLSLMICKYFLPVYN